MVEIHNIGRSVVGNMGTAAIAVAFTALVAAASVPARAQDIISGVGLTHLTVYDQRPAPDGKQSGSPHVHAVTDEGYYVLSGTGKVELHDLKNGFRTVDLTPGRYLQFPPGTLHRLVNTEGLTILVVMGNAGLAEHGDARIYFGKEVDDDPAEYARLTGLPRAKGLEGALDRRDAAIRAYMGLLELWKTDRAAYFADLARFLDAHNKAMAAIKDRLKEDVAAGPVAWSGIATLRLEDLPENRESQVPLLFTPGETTSLGMCGILRPVTNLQPVDRKR
jgi:mannose-6-phosphate isomerase-like protein (cupin superfamily)